MRRLPVREIDTLVLEYARHLDGRDVHQPGIRVVRHRVPAMRTERARPHRLLAVFITGALHFHRPAGLDVDTLGPRHLGDLLGRQQFAVGAIDHIEEAILRRMHQRLDGLATVFQIGQHDVHVGVVVPGLTGGGLVVPFILTGVGVERDDGT